VIRNVLIGDTKEESFSSFLGTTTTLPVEEKQGKRRNKFRKYLGRRRR